MEMVSDCNNLDSSHCDPVIRTIVRKEDILGTSNGVYVPELCCDPLSDIVLIG